MTDLNPPNRQPWTAERIDRLRQLVDAGRGWTDIARALDVVPSTAFAAAKRYLGHQPRPYRRSGARA